MRDVIREDILRCLEQKPEDFEVLLKLLQQEGYEIKRGKHTAICGNEQKRFIRFRSLGEDYTEENLKKIIAGEKELPEKKEKASDQKVVKSEKRKFDLVVDIQERINSKKNARNNIRVFFCEWCKFRLIGPRIPLRTDQPFRM